MRLILLFLCFSIGLSAQEAHPKALSLSAGHEFHSAKEHGWNVTAEGIHAIGTLPRLRAGLLVSFGISEYNSKQVHPTNFTQVSSDFSTMFNERTTHPFYARNERLRFGIRGSYLLFEKGKHEISAALGLFYESILRYREVGVELQSELDTATYTTVYESQYYSIDQGFNELETRRTFSLAHELRYSYRISTRVSVFLGTSLYVRMNRMFRSGGFVQQNLGLRYCW